MMKETTSADLRAGYTFAFLCAFFSALMIVFIKWVETSLPTLSVLFVSQLAAGLVLSTALASSRGKVSLRRVGRKGWIWLFGISGLTFFSYWIWFIAIDLLDPTVASFLGRTETLITILFGIAFLGERFHGKEILGGVIVLIGVAVIGYVGGLDVSRGFYFCLGGALLWGITEGLAKVAVRHVEPLIFTWGRCMILIPIFLASALLSPEGLVLPEEGELWAGLIGLALAGPVLGRYFYMKSLSLIPVSKAALVNQFQPIWVAILAGITLGTIPAAREWIGGALILAGCLILVRRIR